MKHGFLRFAIFLAFAALECIAVGPVLTLPIVDADVTPDGYTRQAVLPNGTFPGPLISGNKNDYFQINVVNLLTNESMLTGTTIVCRLICALTASAPLLRKYECAETSAPSSTGTVSSSTTARTSTAWPS
ncbi:hypothetical protein GSI_13363 [Ganoderma sinense ZZ0214-1]|uniref:Plastocyanin-like domain-containing protein n=1 Tax=Ganoderma sinense ZZ0214-1 TaxID=1077348 RepID=A0A2G8RVE3_9APHY|nr:hypothetical protein GSI_13363 [Ganoderma sinense ZZ0214-1]